MLSYELYLLALGGVAVHYLKDWVAHKKRNVSYGLSKELPVILLSILTSVLLVYVREDISTIYVITPVGAIIVGYAGNSIFFSLINAKKPRNIGGSLDEQDEKPV